MMELVYNSEYFSVVAVALPAQRMQVDDEHAPDTDEPRAHTSQTARGGFEIVDKLTGKGIYLDGFLAQGFERKVQQIVAQGNEDSGEQFENVLQEYTSLMSQVVQR